MTLKGDKGGVRSSEMGGSAKVYSAAGSGSRPGGGKFTIPTSAPSKPHALDSRKPGGKVLK